MLAAKLDTQSLVARPATATVDTRTRGLDGLVRARVLSESTIMVAAFGEIDAANITDLFAGIERHLGGHRQLVLDFSRLDFFGTAGYSVLARVHARCLATGVDWVLVPGPEVERLLRLCDSDGALPTAPNIVSAVAALTRRRRHRPSLRAVPR